MKSILITTLVLGASAVAVAPRPPPVFCAIDVYRDYTFVFAYIAEIHLAPTCPAGGTARVRKTSTVSTRVKGAPYQPINPASGAWMLSRTFSTIPKSALFTFSSWNWEYWDARTQAWIPVDDR